MKFGIRRESTKDESNTDGMDGEKYAETCGDKDGTYVKKIHVENIGGEESE